MTKDNSGPAFPTPVRDDVLNQKGFSVTVLAGLTKREWFAGMALKKAEWLHGAKRIEELVSDAYAIADAMLKAGEEK